MHGFCRIFVPPVMSNLNGSFRNYYLSGSIYQKDGTKQAKPRYHYCDNFNKKMKQYNKIVGEYVATQFYQKITGEVIRFNW